MTTTADQPDINHLTAVNLATVHNFQLALLIIYIWKIDKVDISRTIATRSAYKIPAVQFSHKNYMVKLDCWDYCSRPTETPITGLSHSTYLPTFIVHTISKNCKVSVMGTSATRTVYEIHVQLSYVKCWGYRHSG